MLFWNAGRLPLKASDIVGPISLEFWGSVIGQVKSVASRDVCKPRAKVNGNRIELTFSFLDYGDVIMLSAIHDGPKADPKFHATIMGVPEGVRRSGATCGDTYAADEGDWFMYRPPIRRKRPSLAQRYFCWFSRPC